MSLPTGLSGAHVLVTGGSRGIGKGITKAFLQQGANVSYCAEKLNGKEYDGFDGAIDNAKAVGSVVDITHSEEIEAWVKKSAELFGGIDVVVANGAFSKTPS